MFQICWISFYYTILKIMQRVPHLHTDSVEEPSSVF